MSDLLDESILRQRLENNLEFTNLLLEKVYEQPPVELDALLDELRPIADALRPYIKNTTLLVADCIDKGGSVFFEGAQGTLLDVDHGTYPFVTSSNPTAGGVCTGCGIGPTQIDRVIGVGKAYLTRVGTGPFPTELDNPLGERLREKGHEYGVTTARPRRCGWFDAVAMRHAVRINGLTDLALTKLDVLSGFAPLMVCNAYKYKGELLTEYPSDTQVLAEAEPVYTELPGWTEDISAARTWDELPANTRSYIEWIEEHCGVRASILSLGPERDMAIVRDDFSGRRAT